VDSDFTATLQTIGDDVRETFAGIVYDFNMVLPKIERMSVDFALMASASQIARESLLAEAGVAKAEISEEKRIRADETSALTQFYTALKSTFETNAATVQTMLSTLATADQAVASSITLLQAAVSSNTAAITSEATSRADADSAMASDITQLYTKSAANEAAITNEATARTAADSALASQISTVQASANAANAAVTSEATARANADGALSTQITNVQAQVGDANVAIANEATARANGDSANASLISGVNAEYNGRFAMGLMKFEAVSAPSGVAARFAVLARTGTSGSAATYKTSGLYIDIYSEGGVVKSRVAIQADQFVVTDGDASSVPLVFEGSTLKLANARVDFAKIDNAIFGTTNIDFDAVTAKSSLAGTTSNVSSDAWTTVASVTIANPNPNPVMCQITGTLTADPTTAGSAGCAWRLVNTTTGEVIYATSLFRAADGPSGAIDIDVFRLSSSDVVGNNVYRFQVARTGSISGSCTASINAKFLWWKR